MRVMLIANWGLGLEILKALHKISYIEIATIITGYNKYPKDEWENVVYDFSKNNGYETIDQNKIDLEGIIEKIVLREIDLVIVHAYMRRLPRSLFASPKYGTINIHPSLLPKHRGPSPTDWVIKNKEKITGLTCHYIDEGFDSGNIIYQMEVPIKEEDSVEKVIERQKFVVEPLINESLIRIQDESFKPVPQVSELASYAPKIRKR